MGLLRGKKYPKVRVVSHNKPPLIVSHWPHFLWVVAALCVIVAVLD